jgi:hypothetical protein
LFGAPTLAFDTIWIGNLVVPQCFSFLKKKQLVPAYSEKKEGDDTTDRDPSAVTIEELLQILVRSIYPQATASAVITYELLEILLISVGWSNR